MNTIDTTDTTDTTESEKPKGIKVVELSSKEIWTYEKQVELLSNRRTELEEAGIYCVSGRNIIRPEHRREYRELGEVISILKQKAAGIVNPKPKPISQQASIRRETRKPVSDEERARLLEQFRELKKKHGF